MKTIVQSLESAVLIYTKNFKSYLYALAILAAVFFVTTFLSLFVVFGDQTLNTLNIITTDPDSMQDVFAGADPYTMLLSVMVAFAGFGVLYALRGGMVSMTAAFMKKRKADGLSILFSSSKGRGPMLVFTRLIWLGFLFIAFTASFFAAYALSLYISDLTTGIVFMSAKLTLYAIVGTLFLMLDQVVMLEKKGAMQSLQAAYGFGKRHFLDLFILLILFEVLSGIIFTIPMAGPLLYLLLVTPISIITYTFFYLKNK